MIFLNVDYVKDIFNAMLDKDINNTVSDPKKSLSLILDSMKMKTDFLKNLDIKTEEDVRKLFEIIFYAKKYVNDVISQTPLPLLSKAYSVLKDTSRSYNERVEEFSSLIKGGNKKDVEDMAKEIIHFLEPEKYPLWTRWVWNKERNTGSITYVLKDNVTLKNEDEFFKALSELKSVLDIFGLDTGNYYPTSVFLVYAYVRLLDYTTHLAIDKKAAGLLPTHLTTTALVLGLKPFIKVIKYAHS
ncbi:hypothetical protein HNQ62_002365 [Sulfurisphaera ohwakuensis]|uniref:Uncharacterized protein n=2 Tax=Sulfurisphaera ohwakuensis TaxID=69656 RepID=A0A7J9RUU0_SULOH|nr:hypothetical protein [Sulfurisphaera ohwakuensis]